MDDRQLDDGDFDYEEVFPHFMTLRYECACGPLYELRAPNIAVDAGSTSGCDNNSPFQASDSI
jgi:hypothetical protein